MSPKITKLKESGESRVAQAYGLLMAIDMDTHGHSWILMDSDKHRQTLKAFGLSH